MSLSVTAPLDQAFRRTGSILFKPFDSAKWFKLGFCAFLTQLADCGGGGGGLSNGVDLSKPSFRRELDRFSDWFNTHQVLILSLGLIAVVIGLAILIVLLWLQSRGRFMFLDGVVHARGAVSAPWHRFRSEGNGLFGFAAALAIAGALLGLLALGVGLALAWGDIQAERFGGAAIAGLVVGGGLLALNALVFALLNLFTNDFVVPAMYARHSGVLEAWRTVLREVLLPHPGAIALYVLMKVAIALATALAALTLMCGTLGVACCLMAIPYIGTVVLLPLFVFERSYSLAFLEQLGPTWTLTQAPAANSG